MESDPQKSVVQSKNTAVTRSQDILSHWGQIGG